MNNPLKDAKKSVFATIVSADEEVITLTIGQMSDEQLTELKAETQTALRTGHLVRWPDGREQWETVDMVVSPQGAGSERFIWDKSGNRVKHERFLNTRVNGEITEEIIGTVWKKF